MGHIQSKAIYPTQDQILDVAKQYRQKKLPLDAIVVDFLNMTKQGELDLDPKRWPDPAAMNRDLHAMGVKTLLSVWLLLAARDAVLRRAAQQGLVDSEPERSAGFRQATEKISDPISTPPTRRPQKWFWEKIRDRYVKPYGFDYIWLDETEPDVDPANDRFSIGSGTRYYNVYPLFHTAAVYEGFRRDFGDSRRVMILARAAYLGRSATARFSGRAILSRLGICSSAPSQPG